jgi:hypothetical protein
MDAIQQMDLPTNESARRIPVFTGKLTDNNPSIQADSSKPAPHTT